MKVKEDIQITAVAALLVILALIAAMLPIDKLWGINHLRYFPDIYIGIFAVLGIFVVALPHSKPVRDSVERLLNKVGSFPRWFKILLAAVISFALFYVFKTEVFTLGDGYLRVYHIEQGYSYNHTEPLDYFLHAVFYKLIFGNTEVSAEPIYIWYSIIVGVLFAVSLTLFKFKTERSSDSMIIKLLILITGGLQLFFGYVESYSLVYPVSMLFLLFAFRYYKSGEGFLILSVLMILAFSSHLMGVMLLPAYACLFFLCPQEGEKSQLKIRLTGASLIIAALFLLAYLDYRDWLNFREVRQGFWEQFLPVFGNYSIFSLSHLIDIFNELFLVIPAILILSPVLLKIRGGEKRGRFLLILMVGFPLIFIFTVNPQLGFARDWDLFSIPTAIIGVALLLYVYYNSAGWGNISLISRLTAVLAAILFVSLWVVTNSSEERQLARAENIILLSDEGQGYGLELLAHHYSEKLHDNNKALAVLHVVKGEARNARVLYKIARLEYQNANYAVALRTAEEGLALDSTYSRMRFLAGAASLNLDNPQTAIEYLNAAGGELPFEAMLFRFLGEAYRRVDSLDKSLEAWDKAVILEPQDPSGYFNRANLYYQMADYSNAFAQIKLCLGLRQNYPGAAQLQQAILEGINKIGSEPKR